MANMVDNVLLFRNQEQLSYAKNLLVRGERVDFNVLVPQPAWIYRATLNTHKTAEFEPFTWETWRKFHWGGKRNATGTKFLGSMIYFESATNPPFPVITALANKLFRIDHGDGGWTFKHLYYSAGADTAVEDVWDYDSINNAPARIASNRDEEAYKLVRALIAVFDSLED